MPLYASVFDKFDGTTLPGDSGLESVLAELGVAEKQTDKARQALQRSAKQAGFFGDGVNRLVKPSFRSSSYQGASTAAARSSEPVNNAAEGPASLEAHLHPLIHGLMQTLPKPGSTWSETQQDQWLAAAKANFALIYQTERPALSPPRPDPVEQATA